MSWERHYRAQARAWHEREAHFLVRRLLRKAQEARANAETYERLAEEASSWPDAKEGNDGSHD